MVARLVHTQQVAGSSPALATKMKKVLEFANRVRKINMTDVLNEEIREQEATILDFNIERLRLKGETSDGILISSFLPYAERTIFEKSLDGTLTNNNPTIVNLRDKGDFQRAFFIIYKRKSFSIYSRDEKTSELVFHYGEEIFGLTDSDLEKLNIQWIKPGIIERLNKLR